ncbi:MAG TPA: CoA transferase [Acidimicrobiales bacterium]|nr:CoA transferase [Acidimicrobiales bacterium]
MPVDGPLSGIRVVELASEHAAFAGTLLGGLGAEVIVVEPPGGHRTRGYEPFVDDEPGLERSLWWWHYNASKLGVVLDLGTTDGAEQFRALVATADVVLEGERPGALRDLGLDYPDLRPARPDLIWVSVTPFGRSGPKHHDHATDLTVLAGGGPVWNCGYDDHSLPPVRGGGNQGFQTACLFATMSALTAWLHRDHTGVGQFVDVSMHAAANVTTEAGSYEYLVAGRTVQRMTGRHASVRLSTPSIGPAADGRLIHTGVPPRFGPEFVDLLGWLDDLGLRDEYPETFFIEMGVARGGVQLSEIHTDVEAQAIFNAGREALRFIAARVGAYEFFTGAQSHGIAAGIVYAPEEVIEDPHFVARGFPVPVEHPELGRTITYPGLPFVCPAAPGGITRAPRLGEHDEQILGPLR